MPVINTEYGLLYNTDNTLVTTIRDDKVPFAGVKSFAVESETTNLFGRDAWEFDADQSTFYTSSLASGKTWADCWDEKQKAYVGGHNITALRFHSQNIDLGQVYDAGTQIALSWKHKGYLWGCYFYYGETTDNMTQFVGNDTYIYRGDITSYFPTHSISFNGILARDTGHPEQLLDRWYDAEIVYTLPTNTRYIQIMWDFYNAYQANGNRGVPGYIHQPQLEISPFCSSFVAGSRPNGRYVIPTEKLGFNIETDNWVVTYMKYPVATHDGTQNGYNGCSLGQGTSDRSKGYIWWGKEITTNKYKLVVILNDATVISNISDNTFNPADYFYHWHYEVMKKQGKVLSYYVDGVKQCEVTIPADKEIQTPFNLGLSLGAGSGTTPHNALIANVGNGKLQPGEFTDKHIMAIYEANRAFAQKGGVKIY